MTEPVQNAKPAASELDRLRECETIIEKGVATFIEVGEALIEIREDKLYRETHKTFEAYCRERWDLGRSHAYRLIDQAKVAVAIGEAVGICPPLGDIPERTARAIKADLPAVVEDIKARVEGGEKPEVAVAEAIKSKRSAAVQEKADRAEAAAEAKRVRDAKQSENDRTRDEHRANLSPEVQAMETAKQSRKEAAKAPTADVEAMQAEIEELREENAELKAEVARLKTDSAKWDDMRVQFEKGGFEAVIAGKDEVIRTQATRIERESHDKAKWMRSAKSWEKKARAHGYSADVIIDAKTGELTNA